MTTKTKPIGTGVLIVSAVAVLCVLGFVQISLADGPHYDGNQTKYPSGVTYDAAITHGFQIDFIVENVTKSSFNTSNVSFIANFTGVNVTYTNFTTPGIYNATPILNNTAATFVINFTNYQFVKAAYFQYFWNATNGTTTITTNNITAPMDYVLNHQAINLTVSPATQPLTYGSSITPYCMDNFTVSTYHCGLYVNDANATAATYNGTAIVLGVAGSPYTYVVNTSAPTANYTWSTQAAIVTVNKQAFTYSLSPSTQTVTYGGSVTQYAASNDTTGASSLTLWRNGTNITASGLNGTSDVLTAGVWVYWANSTFNPANYSYTNQTAVISVNKKAFTFGLWPSNGTISYGTYSEYATSNDTAASSQLTIWRNNTLNITNGTVEPLPVGVWNFTANSTQPVANYSWSVTINNVTVDKLSFTIGLSPENGTVTYGTLNEYVNSTANAANSSLTLWRNETNITTSLNGTSEPLPVGFWNFTANSTCAVENCTWTAVLNNVTVNKGVSNISLFIGSGTGTEGNAGITQGNILNLTASINTSYSIVLELNATLGPPEAWADKQSTATSLNSTSNASSYNALANYNITAHFAGDANYTGDTQTWLLDISAAPTTTTTLASTSSGSASTASTSATTLTISSLLAGVPKVINEVSLPYDAKLTSIQLTTNTAATAVQMAVQSYASKPSDVATAAAPDIYKYVSVSFTNLAANNVQTAKIAFKVEKSWLTLKSLSANDVALYRYTGGAWTVLSTSKTSEDGIYAYYQATTPGFSYFAIGGQASTSATTTTTLPAAGQTTTTTVPGIATTTTIASAGTTPADYTWILVIGIVAVAAFALVLKFKPFGIGGKAWNKY